MSVNVDQLAATAGSLAAVFAVGGAGMAWIGRHLARRVALTAKGVTADAITESTTTLLERMDTSDAALATQLSELQRRAEDDRLEMARQFGGNGNGMRQAIDGVSNLVSQTAERISNLEGKFAQHIAEGRS
jgi:hypothetical protein